MRGEVQSNRQRADSIYKVQREKKQKRGRKKGGRQHAANQMPHHLHSPLTLQTSEQQSAPLLQGSSRNRHALSGWIEFDGGSPRHCSGSHRHRPFSTAPHSASVCSPQHLPAHGKNPGSAVRQQNDDGGATGRAHSQCISSINPLTQSLGSGVVNGQPQRQLLELWICPGPGHGIGHWHSQSLSTLLSERQSLASGAHDGHSQRHDSGLSTATPLHSSAKGHSQRHESSLNSWPPGQPPAGSEPRGQPQAHALSMYSWFALPVAAQMDGSRRWCCSSTSNGHWHSHDAGSRSSRHCGQTHGHGAIPWHGSVGDAVGAGTGAAVNDRGHGASRP